MSHTTVVSECSVVADFKQKANRLKSLLKHLSPPPTLSDCLEYLSKLDKARDWNTMKARLEQQEKGKKPLAPVLVMPFLQTAEDSASSALHDHAFYAKDPDEKLREIKRFTSRVLWELIDKAATQQFFFAERTNLPIRNNPHNVAALVEEVFIDKSCDPGNCETRFNLVVMPHAVEALDIETKMFFPKSRRAEALRLLDSEVMKESMKPSLTSGKNWEDKDCHIITFKHASLSSFCDPGKTIMSDPRAVMHFQDCLKETMAGLGKIHEAFNDLAGVEEKASAPHREVLLELVEDAIWDNFSSGQPRYMASVEEFFALAVEGLRLKAEMTTSGPIVRRGNDWVGMSDCSVIIEPENRDNFWIAKNENDLRISLAGLSRKAVATLAKEFGLPVNYEAARALDMIDEETRREASQYRGISGSEAYRMTQGIEKRLKKLYGSNAFKGLRDWVEKYPLKAKKLSEESSVGWLSDWYERATQKV